MYSPLSSAHAPLRRPSYRACADPTLPSRASPLPLPAASAHPALILVLVPSRAIGTLLLVPALTLEPMIRDPQLYSFYSSPACSRRSYALAVAPSTPVERDRNDPAWIWLWLVLLQELLSLAQDGSWPPVSAVLTRLDPARVSLYLYLPTLHPLLYALSARHGHVSPIFHVIGNLRYLPSDGYYAPFLRLLLESGANIDAKHGRALSNASSRGGMETVHHLLRNGANIHLTYGALWAACSARNMEISTGVSVHVGEKEIVQLLLQSGADGNLQGGTYGSVLACAAFTGKKDIIQILLQSGADVNLGGKYGSALAAAYKSRNKEIAKLFLDNAPT
ncbi:ankyrin repeat-containing domain protein [Mycena latifolia]|nr:ankyrin repeat-containing domain protein [Mycena latifolia]